MTPAFMLLMLAVGGALNRKAPVLNSTGAPPSLQPAPTSAAKPDAVATRAHPVGGRVEELPAMQRALSLANAGRFSAAAEAALTAPEELRLATLSSVFSPWADKHPHEAAAAALSLAEEAQRNVAWHAVATRWAENDPAALVVHAWSLVDESARGRALDLGVPRWMERDETSALAWVGALPSSRASDPAVALVASRSSLIEYDPESALCWAETITDRDLRSRTLSTIARAWLLTAPEAAARYARHSPDIFPTHREDILVGERFTAHP
jgi:hypothetical protein